MPIYKTKNKKDGIQQYRVFVSYTSADGTYKKKSKTVYGKEEAKQAERELMQEAKASDSGQITVSELHEIYLESKKNEVRQTTLDKARRNAELYILPELGSIRLDKLTSARLQKWKNWMSEKNLSISTLQGRYKDFHALLAFAVKVGYIAVNPLNRVGTFRNAYKVGAEEQIHYYTADQWEQYDRASAERAEERNDMLSAGMRTFFVVAFYTGMRKGEINALKWSDIDGNTIHVRRSISEKIKGKSIVETPPKNKSSYRDIQMPNVLMEHLEKHKEYQKRFAGFSNDWRVCGGAEPLRDTTIEKWNAETARRAELPHIRIHDFRHSHASLLCNAGINIQEISRRLGHSNVTMTWNVYSHLYPSEQEKAVSVLDSIGEKKKGNRP